jgi:hypothetical protein
MENFVRDYGTGNLIPNPPGFVNYASADAPSSSSRPTTRTAQFARSSQRAALRAAAAAAAQPPAEEPVTNTAGVGAGGSRRADPQPEASVSRAPTHGRGTSRGQNPPQANGASVNGASSSSQVTRRPTQSYKPPQDPNAEPIDPTAETFIKVGANAYKVDINHDPQQGPSRPAASSSSQSSSQLVDPLAKQLEELKNAVSGSGTVRRSGTWKPMDPRAGQTSRKGTTELSAAGPSSLPLPSTSAQASGSQRQASRDYRTSAEVVVGAHPSVSRPSSPNPPTASFMQEPPKTSSQTEAAEIVTKYQQSFPGERKSISRSDSRQGNQGAVPLGQGPASNHSHNLSQGQNLARPVSREGHPGIGAHGRSSPQPLSRSASPAAGNNVVPPQRGPAPGIGYNQRAVSPNRVGIALDPNGTVVVDKMADRYNQQQEQLRLQQYNASVPPRRLSYMGANNSNIPPPPIQQPAYGIAPPPPPPAGYQPNANTAYMNSAGPQRPMYNPAPVPVPYQMPPPQQPVYQQQLPQSVPYGGMDPRGPPPMAGSYGSRMVPPSQLPPPQQAGYGGAYRSPSPMARTPSPLPQQLPPTGQTTEDGRGILFYG